MIMLIPFGLVLFLVVVLLSVSAGDGVEAQKNLNNQLVNAVAFHHEIVISREEDLDGVVVLRERDFISPMEGLTSFVFRDADQTFILTWPRRYTVGADFSDPSPQSETAVARIMETARENLEIKGVRGSLDQGPLTDFDGVQYQVGRMLMPFQPPALDGAPIIITRLGGS